MGAADANVVHLQTFLDRYQASITVQAIRSWLWYSEAGSMGCSILYAENTHLHIVLALQAQIYSLYY